MSIEQAMTSAEWLAFFAHTDHEDDKGVPGPYEQGAQAPAYRVEFDEYWD